MSPWHSLPLNDTSLPKSWKSEAGQDSLHSFAPYSLNFGSYVSDGLSQQGHLTVSWNWEWTPFANQIKVHIPKPLWPNLGYPNSHLSCSFLASVQMTIFILPNGFHKGNSSPLILQSEKFFSFPEKECFHWASLSVSQGILHLFIITIKGSKEVQKMKQLSIWKEMGRAEMLGMKKKKRFPTFKSLESLCRWPLYILCTWSLDRKRIGACCFCLVISHLGLLAS